MSKISTMNNSNFDTCICNINEFIEIEDNGLICRLTIKHKDGRFIDAGVDLDDARKICAALNEWINA